MTASRSDGNCSAVARCWAKITRKDRIALTPRLVRPSRRDYSSTLDRRKRFLTRRGANSLCCGQQQKEKGAPPNQLQLTPPGLHEPEGAVCKVLTTDMPQQIDTLAEITRRSITKLTLRAAYTRNARLDPRAAEKVFWAQNVTAICEQNRNFRSLAEGSV